MWGASIVSERPVRVGRSSLALDVALSRTQPRLSDMSDPRQWHHELHLTPDSPRILSCRALQASVPAY